jgi:hypothetical protein
VQKGGFANFLNNFVNNKAKDVDKDNEDNEGSLYDEVEAYLRMPQIPVQDSSGNDQNILAWWRDTSNGLPYLAKMARQFLAAPASSAASERLFSRAGKMHDDLKKSTSESTLESQLSVAVNYPDA